MANCLSYACIGKKGKRRINQDNLFLDGLYLEEKHKDIPLITGSIPLNSPHTFGVFDGMAGECDGAAASAMAAKYLAENVQKIQEKENPFQIKKAIGQLCLGMNKEICDYARLHKYSAMGTTMAGVTIFHDMVYGYNIGDSRIYHFSESGLKQCSRDHVPLRIFNHGGLTQYLGIPETDFVICPDTFYMPVKDKDIYLICSDGLSNNLSDEVLNDILISYPKMEDAIEQMLFEAEEIGLKDNTTVIIIQIEKSNK